MKNYLLKVLIFVSFIMICLVVGVYVHAKDNNDMSVAFYKAKKNFNEKISKNENCIWITDYFPKEYVYILEIEEFLSVITYKS